MCQGVPLVDAIDASDDASTLRLTSHRLALYKHLTPDAESRGLAVKSRELCERCGAPDSRRRTGFSGFRGLSRGAHAVHL